MRERQKKRERDTHTQRSVMRIPCQTQSRLLAVNGDAGWVMKDTQRNHHLGNGAQ